MPERTLAIVIVSYNVRADLDRCLRSLASANLPGPLLMLPKMLPAKILRLHTTLMFSNAGELLPLSSCRKRSSRLAPTMRGTVRLPRSL